MSEREWLTEEEVLGLLRAMGRPRQREEPSLEAALPQSRGPQEWKEEERGLTVRWHYDEDIRQDVVVLSGSEEWRGALVHCQWQWFDATRPEEKREEAMTAFIRMPPEPDPWGDYRVEVVLPEPVAGCPDVARIVPRYADPERFVEAWRAARVKPSLEELAGWIREHENEFAHHRERWLQLPEKLRSAGLR